MANNTTTTAIHRASGAEYILLLWCIACFILSIAGNMLVLVSSLVYRVIKLDRITLTLLENIAVADMVVGVITIFPRIVSLIAGKWVFGDLLCDLSFPFGLLFEGAGVLCITAMNISKLTCLLFPLRARTRSRTVGRAIAITLWVTIVLIVLVLETVAYFKAGKSFEVQYEPYLFRCDKDVDDEVITKIYYALLILFTYIPTVLIAVTTAWLLLYLRKVRGLQKESIVLLLFISVVFFISYVPVGTTPLATMNKHQYSYEIQVAWDNFSHSVSYLSTASNPIIYYLTVKDFKFFVRSLFSYAAAKMGIDVEMPLARGVSISVHHHDDDHHEDHKSPNFSQMLNRNQMLNRHGSVSLNERGLVSPALSEQRRLSGLVSPALSEQRRISGLMSPGSPHRNSGLESPWLIKARANHSNEASGMLSPSFRGAALVAHSVGSRSTPSPTK